MGLQPLTARPLPAKLVAGPQEMSIFSGHEEPVQVHYGQVDNGIEHGIQSRPSVSVTGTVVAGGGWPAPILRGFSFAVLPPSPKLVNVVTGVPSYPTPRQRRTRR